MLKMNFLILIAVFPVIVHAQAAPSGGTEEYLGALVPNCEVDKVREANGKRLDKATEGASEVIRAHGAEKPSKASCFDKLRQLASYINFAIPSSIFNQGLIDRIKDRACNEAVRAVQNVVSRNRIALTSPYGLYGIEVGASGSESGVNVEETGPALDKVEDLIINSTGGIINNAGKDAAADLDEAAGVSDINRDGRAIKREGEGEVNDEFDSVREGVNAI